MKEVDANDMSNFVDKCRKSTIQDIKITSEGILPKIIKIFANIIIPKKNIGRIERWEVMMVGRVKWFNNEKGYGFIEFKENEDIFVHYSAIELDGYKTLSEGQLVEFKLIETSKGYQAINVKLVKEATNLN